MLKRFASILLSLLFLGASSGLADGKVPVPDILKNRIPLKKTEHQLNIVYFLGSDTAWAAIRPPCRITNAASAN